MLQRSSDRSVAEHSEPTAGGSASAAAATRRSFCPRSTMRVPQPDIIEHFGNADAVPQAAGAVLKPQGGNCAVLPQLTALVAGVQSIKIRRQLGRLAAFILLKKIAHKFNVFTLNS